MLVVGELASALIDSGALASRLEAAHSLGAPVVSERAFIRTLTGQSGAVATLPLITALGSNGLSAEDAELLSAFDLIAVQDGKCRFGDAAVLRTAGELVAGGRSVGEAIRILIQARDQAPVGRHKVVLTGTGEAALRWDDGLTTLGGQGFLPLGDDHASLDDLFEGAAIAQAEGDLDTAARLYDQCARSDRKDAIALFNFGNIRLTQGALDEAVMAYQRALKRDHAFAEARYNMATALEAQGKHEAAADLLHRVVMEDPTNADAIFNLAQLKMQAGDLIAAQALFADYLDLDPPDEWAEMARKGLLVCAAELRRG